MACATPTNAAACGPPSRMAVPLRLGEIGAMTAPSTYLPPHASTCAAAACFVCGDTEFRSRNHAPGCKAVIACAAATVCADVTAEITSCAPLLAVIASFAACTRPAASARLGALCVSA